MTLIPPSYGGDLQSFSVQVTVEVPPKFLESIAEEFIAGLPRVMNQIGLLGHSYWQQQASAKLHSSSRDYIRALSYQVVGNTVELTLGGANMKGAKNTFVLAVELGGPKFDMKPGFLNSPKARTGPRKFPRELREKLKRGPGGPMKYLIVPIVKDRSVVASAANVKFRTVHSASPPSSWWHPGWKGVKISDDVSRELNERIIPEAFKPLLESIE